MLLLRPLRAESSDLVGQAIASVMRVSYIGFKE